MAKGLNFRNFNQPTLPIQMNDAKETLFTCVAPTVELVERLEANQDAIIAVFKKGDRECLEELWKLTADLISCNREHRSVTAEELKGKYCMNYQMLFAFLVAYREFIDEIESAKN
jgi:hypothetical protein